MIGPARRVFAVIVAAVGILGLAPQARADEPPVDEVRFEGGRYLFAELQGQRCVIALQGTIGPDTTRQFKVVMERAAEKRCEAPLIVLQSRGGAVEDGLSLGRQIHAAGYSTIVSESCASSCGLIFLGGRERVLLGAKARIGFHQAGRVEDATSANRRKICSTDRRAEVNRRIRGYLKEVMGEDGEPIFERTMGTSCHSMDWVRGELALSMGVATELR